jgi:hypothetical protein
MVYENTCTRTWSYMVISCNAHSSKRKLCGSRMYLGPSIPSLQGTNSLGDHDTTEPLKKLSILIAEFVGTYTTQVWGMMITQ